MKRDGHTHSFFCLHGSGEETEEFVRRAIELGFTSYSVTEHLPLPADLLKVLPYPGEFKEALEIREDLDAYFREMERLKRKYKDKIQLLTGVEMDFLPGHREHSRYLLKEYGRYLDDGLLSVHIMWGQGGWRCVDHSPADFQEGLINCYGSYEEAQLAYFTTVREALAADLGPNKPRRIGHLCLCNKFQKVLNPGGLTGGKVVSQVKLLLAEAAQRGYGLDVNVAGLFKKHCGEIYTPSWVVEIAKKLGIELVYGSDTHAVSEVGRAYEQYVDLVGEKKSQA